MTENKYALIAVIRDQLGSLDYDVTDFERNFADALIAAITTPPAQDAMREALEKIAADNYPSAQTMNEIARAALSTPQPESVEATVERVAHALWLNEAIRAAPNVARNRTIEAFRSELNDRDRIVWLDAANAALAAMPAMNAPPAIDEDANLSGDFPC